MEDAPHTPVFLPREDERGSRMSPAVSELINPRSSPSVVLIVCAVLLGILEGRGGRKKGRKRGEKGRGGEGRGRKKRGREGRGREGKEEEGRGLEGRKGEGKGGKEKRKGEERRRDVLQCVLCVHIRM